MNPILTNLLAGRPFQDFQYTAAFQDANVIPALGVATVDIPIQTDGDFVALYATATAVTDAAPETVLAAVPLLVQVTDSGAGRNFFDRPTHANNVFGVGERALDRQPYWYLRKGGTVRVTVTNLQNAILRAWVTFVGLKVFPVGQSAGSAPNRAGM